MNIALPAQEGDRLTGGTIRMHRHSSVRRAIAMVTAVAVLAQSAACSYVPTRPDQPDEHTCAQEKAEVLASAKDLAKDQQAIFFNVTVDGRWRCAVAVPKDEYVVGVFVPWSDGTTEKYDPAFFMSIEPGRQYSMLAYEAGVGHVPATATLTARQAPENAVTTTPPTRASQAARGIAAGIVVAPLLPILIPLGILSLPFYIPYQIIKKQKEAELKGAKPRKWGSGCCYLWIEDAETRETIAGTAPSVR